MSTASPPRFSLITATLDRPDALARLIRSLETQEVGCYRLIIVDQSSPAHAERCRSIAAAARNVTYIHSQRRGLSLARNIGLAEVSGEFVGFPDDDCWYPPHLLAAVTAWFDGHPRHGLVSGRYGEPERPSPAFATRPGPLRIHRLGGRLSSITFFMRSRLIADLGLRFDEGLGAGSPLPAGEEFDFVMSALERGARGAYDPSLLVHHAIEREYTSAARAACEEASTLVLARHAFRPSLPLLATLAARVLKDAAFAWSPRHRGRLRSRIRGLRLAARGLP